MGFDLGKALGVSGGSTGALVGAAAGFGLGGPAGAGIGSQIGGSIGNIFSQENTNKQNIGLARDQMAFQERMSNTAHQREVDDLKKAGLNPILSAGGNGASSPSGAAPNLTAPQITMPDFMAYGMSLKQLELQEKKLSIEGATAAANIAKTSSETDLTKMKQVLAQKGMMRAELEGEASAVMRNVIKFLKKGVTNPSQPGKYPNTTKDMNDTSEQFMNHFKKP